MPGQPTQAPFRERRNGSSAETSPPGLAVQPRSPSVLRSTSTGSRFANTTKSAWFPFSFLSLTSAAPRVLGRGPRVKPYRVSDEQPVTVGLLQASLGRFERTRH